jgi:hypothetical protein
MKNFYIVRADEGGYLIQDFLEKNNYSYRLEWSRDTFRDFIIGI